jgi:hypothetical protein
MVRHLAAFGALAAAALTLGAGDASAAIRCQGPNQIINGEPLATPYCADAYLAVVARQYGVAVSGAEIRSNYNRKRRVCELIGNDIRVSSICAGLRPSDRGGRKLLLN